MKTSVFREVVWLKHMSPVCFDNKPVLDNSNLTASVEGVCPTAALSGFDFFTGSSYVRKR